MRVNPIFFDVEPRKKKIVTWLAFFALSISIHLLFMVFWLWQPKFLQQQTKPVQQLTANKSLKVSLQPPQLLPKQIVDAPIAGVEELPNKADFLGIRDQRVTKETIARNYGEAVNQARQSSTKQQEKNMQLSKNLQQNNSDSRLGQELDSFLPDVFAQSSATGAQQSRQANAIARPFGDVTLLNTKSYPFSQYLIERGYRALRLLTLNTQLATWYANDIGLLDFPAVVMVDVSASGEILTASILRQSGVAQLDRLLLGALRGALQGASPPKEALEEGKLSVVLVLEHDVLSIGIR